MSATDPKTCKAIGKTVKNFDAEKWDSSKYQIVYNGTYAKFSSNDELRRALILTENKTLAEASPYDKIWGIGLYASNADAKNPEKWPGENLLGKVLMDVRYRLTLEERWLTILDMGVHAGVDYPNPDNYWVSEEQTDEINEFLKRMIGAIRWKDEIVLKP